MGISNPPLKQDASGTHYTFIPQNKNYINSLTFSRKQLKKPSSPKPKSSSTRHYTPKCRIMSKRSSPGSTSKINRTMTSYNGLGALDETTLIPLNTVDAVVTEDKKEQQHRGYCFHCCKYGHYKAQCRRLQKELYYATKTNTANTNQVDAPKPKCDTCGIMHKTDKGWDGANAANDKRKKNGMLYQPIKSSNNPYPQHNQKN